MVADFSRGLFSGLINIPLTRNIGRDSICVQQILVQILSWSPSEHLRIKHRRPFVSFYRLVRIGDSVDGAQTSFETAFYNSTLSSCGAFFEYIKVIF